MNYQEYLEKGQAILRRFHELTYEAYFVGGMVRDYVLKVDFVDIDIATSATPQEVQKFFPDVDMEFAGDGCVIVKDGEYEFEVSTFKREEYGSVSRHPTIKYYSTNLADDISRRDFTINALAMTEKLKVIDLCNGLKDLKRKRIRVIGRAKKRFKEDPLRILRGFELIARFGYHFAFSTAKGIEQSAKLLANISDTKLNEKMIIIFDAKHGKKALKKMIQLKASEELRGYSKGIPFVMKNFSKLSTEEKFALCYFLNGEIPANTSFDRVMLTKIKTILKTLQEVGEDQISRMHILHYGADILASVDKIRSIVNPEIKSDIKNIEKLGRSMPISSVSDMAFKGNDLIELAGGQTGPYVSEVVEALREKVVLEEVKNEYAALKKEATKILIEKGILEGPKKRIKKVTVEDETLLKQYNLELEKLVNANLTMLVDDSMNKEEVEQTRKQVEKNMKDILVKKNPKYKELEEGGLI